MYANQRVLTRDGRFHVRTKHDAMRIDMLIVSGHRVLVAPVELILHDIKKNVSVEVGYPAGTGFMFNGEQKIYQIFREGMYHMLRSKAHAARGERDDSREMHEMQQLTFDFVSRLRTWVLIGDEGKDFTDQSLVALANSLDHPKRNEHKLKAAGHYRKASQLKTPNGKRTPMPAAFTASAGAQSLDRRRDDVQAILGWLDPERRAVLNLVDGIHNRFHDAWRFFSPEEMDKVGHPVVLAAAKPTAQTVKVMRDRLRPIYRGLEEVRVRPLNGVADSARVWIATLGRKIKDAHEPVDISPELAMIREALAFAKIVQVLEMDVILPLSALLARWKKLDHVKRQVVRLRAAEACLTFGRSIEPFVPCLPDKRQEMIKSEMELANKLASDTDVDLYKQLNLLKKTLKRLSSNLT